MLHLRQSITVKRILNPVPGEFAELHFLGRKGCFQLGGKLDPQFFSSPQQEQLGLSFFGFTETVGIGQNRIILSLINFFRKLVK